MYALALGAILDTVQDTFNRYAVSELYELNGVPAEYRATWEHGDIERRDIEEYTMAVTRLVRDGVLIPDRTLEAAVREEVGLPPITPKEEPETSEDQDVGAIDFPPVEPVEPLARPAEIRERRQKVRGHP